MVVFEDYYKMIIDVVVNADTIREAQSNASKLSKGMGKYGEAFKSLQNSLTDAGLSVGFTNKAMSSLGKNMKSMGIDVNSAGYFATKTGNDLLRLGDIMPYIAKSMAGFQFKPASLKQTGDYWNNISTRMKAAGTTFFKIKPGIRGAQEELTEMGYALNSSGDMVDKNTGKLMTHARVTAMANRASYRPFQAQWLSILFIGQQMTAMFGGMIQSVLQATGIFDAWRGILMGILMPILAPLIAKWLPKLLDFLSDDGNKKMVGALIIFLAVLGAILNPIAQFALLFSSLGIEMSAVFGWFTAGAKGLTAFGNVLARIAGVVTIVVGVFNVLYGVLNGLIWPILKGLMIVMAGILFIIGGWIPVAIGAAILAITALAERFGYVRAVVMTLMNPIAGVVDLLYGLWGLASGKGFSNFGKVFSKHQANIKSAWGAGWGNVPQMAEGGIVTRPTLAMIGEAGPEAVVPLGSGGGVGGNINYNPSITINTGSNLDINTIVKKVNEGLYNDLRRVGIR
jgi:hypothetical protein